MKNKKIQIYINGKKKNINVNDNLNNILEDFSIKNKLVAIELNKEVVPKSKYKTKRISQNDRIEILELIGGG
tara:strand:+ start:1503 stop:1718 length:216 start_codon:yes stop_codon:yes gene_type:complete